jgi:AcrR family transcriptional regulator
LDAALRVFTARGYERASLNDVAAEAQLKKPSLYYYIQTKEDLLEAIIVRSHERLTSQLKALPAQDSALAMIRQIIHTHVLFNLHYGAEASVFQADLRMLSPERQTAIREVLNGYDRSLRALVEEAQRRREIPNETDANLAVLWMLGGANHVVRWYHPRPGSDPEAIATQFAELSVAALRCAGQNSADGVAAAQPAASTV